MLNVTSVTLPHVLINNIHIFKFIQKPKYIYIFLYKIHYSSKIRLNQIYHISNVCTL